MIPPEAVRSLIIELLRANPTGQIATLVEDVARLAATKGIVPGSPVQGASATTILSGRGYDQVFDIVQQHLWLLLARGVLVWGMNGANPNYPFYRLTEHGRSAVAAGNVAQPYDPDGFLQEFQQQVPTTDAIIRDYLEEAVRAFNAACYRSAAVMLGCASEKAILLLATTFCEAIQDEAAKKRFASESAGTGIHRTYKALKDRLDQMVQRKALPRDHAETVGSELPAGFELVRRCRNEAGHPDAGGRADQNTVFMNLRTFIEYARRVQGLADHFAKNPASW